MKKLLLLSVIMLMASCATIIAPRGKMTIPVQSNVESVEILINGISMGVDPGEITVMKGDIVTAIKRGHTKSATLIQGKFNNWVLGNLIFGGLIGIVVDYATGNIHEVTTTSVYAKLDLKEGEMRKAVEVKANVHVEVYIGMPIIDFKNNYPTASLHSLEKGKAVYSLSRKLIYFENDKLVKIGASGEETISYKKN